MVAHVCPASSHSRMAGVRGFEGLVGRDLLGVIALGAELELGAANLVGDLGDGPLQPHVAPVGVEGGLGVVAGGHAVAGVYLTVGPAEKSVQSPASDHTGEPVEEGVL